MTAPSLTLPLATRLGEALAARGWRVSTAESCTGGGIASAITDVAGASAWFEVGFVTYANTAKIRLLGVSAETLARQGAVSEAVAAEMATGAQAASGAELAVAVSGIAGPGGGSVDKPVGTVCFGFAGPDGVKTETRHFGGTRADIRIATVIHALAGLLDLLGRSTRAPEGSVTP
jgi:nicotinamide-nucleotide amidase